MILDTMPELQKYFVDCTHNDGTFTRFAVEVWAYDGEAALRAARLMIYHPEVSVDSYAEADYPPTAWTD